VAGVLIALFGEGICFLLNALSFIPVIIALLLMTTSLKVHPLTGKRHNVARSFKEGFRYAFRSMPIRTLLLSLSVISFLTGVLQTLLPVLVKDVYHYGSRGFGFIMSMSGVGAFLGALSLAGRKTVLGLGRRIGVAMVVFSVILLFFGFVTDINFAGFLVFLMGFCMLTGIGSTNVVLQTIVEEDKRGRVMSLYGAALVGMTPMGSLLAGALAGRVGLAFTLAFGGAVCLIAAVFYWRNYPHFRLQLRKVYVEKGIIPEE